MLSARPRSLSARPLHRHRPEAAVAAGDVAGAGDAAEAGVAVGASASMAAMAADATSATAGVVTSARTDPG